MNAKPIIGISVDCHRDPEDPRTRGKLELNWNYAQCIVDAGGVPVLIPPMADMQALALVIDGWLIPGGNDIDAREWGEENHPSVNPIERERFEGERRMAQAAAPEMPVLGICYGCQFLNVARGGSLVQHLPDVVGHGTHSGGTLQRYEVDEGSKLAAITGPRPEGKSYHHQAVGRPGQGIRVVAKGEDGTVEAIEATDRPWLIGVQWHPERTMESQETRRLFESFVQAAAQYARHKGRVGV